MTAQDFWEKFQEIFKEDKEGKAIKYWLSSKAYTQFILEAIESFLEGQSFETSREYYRIDLIAWTQLKHRGYLLKDRDFENYLWDLEVAVEHENNDKSWMDEVVKLMHINCPLRIVIGYLPLEENKQIYISALNTEIKKVKTFNKASFLKIKQELCPRDEILAQKQKKILTTISGTSIF